MTSYSLTVFAACLLSVEFQEIVILFCKLNIAGSWLLMAIEMRLDAFVNRPQT